MPSFVFSNTFYILLNLAQPSLKQSQNLLGNYGRPMTCWVFQRFILDECNRGGVAHKVERILQFVLDKLIKLRILLVGLREIEQSHWLKTCLFTYVNWLESWS
jgi:hypothetical protein